MTTMRMFHRGDQVRLLDQCRSYIKDEILFSVKYGKCTIEEKEDLVDKLIKGELDDECVLFVKDCFANDKGAMAIILVSFRDSRPSVELIIPVSALEHVMFEKHVGYWTGLEPGDIVKFDDKNPYLNHYDIEFTVNEHKAENPKDYLATWVFHVPRDEESNCFVVDEVYKDDLDHKVSLRVEGLKYPNGVKIVVPASIVKLVNPTKEPKSVEDF